MKQMIQNCLTVLMFSAFQFQALAQLNITFSINTTQDNHPISPYIYGSNSSGSIWTPNSTLGPLEKAAHVTSRRLGGDRSETYNWENNASTSGSYGGPNEISDGYAAWTYDGATTNATPNFLLHSFHAESISQGTYSLMTLPMIGYVAGDKTTNWLNTTIANDLANGSERNVTLTQDQITAAVPEE